MTNPSHCFRGQRPVQQNIPSRGEADERGRNQSCSRRASTRSWCSAVNLLFRRNRKSRCTNRPGRYRAVDLAMMVRACARILRSPLEILCHFLEQNIDPCGIRSKAPLTTRADARSRTVSTTIVRGSACTARAIESSLAVSTLIAFTALAMIVMRTTSFAAVDEGF